MQGGRKEEEMDVARLSRGGERERERGKARGSRSGRRRSAKWRIVEGGKKTERETERCRDRGWGSKWRGRGVS